MDNPIILTRKAEKDFFNDTHFLKMTCVVQSKHTELEDDAYEYTISEIKDVNGHDDPNDEIDVPANETPGNIMFIESLVEEDGDDFAYYLSSSAAKLEEETLSNLLILPTGNKVSYLFRLKQMFTDHKTILEKFANPNFSMGIWVTRELYATPEYVRKINTQKRDTLNNIIEFLDFHLDVEKDLKVEDLPEYDYKTDTQKIAWLEELGVVSLILEKIKKNGSYNWSKAANIISSFTDLNYDLVRQCITALYQPTANQKNNPLKNPDNRLFVQEMRNKFGLD